MARLLGEGDIEEDAKLSDGVGIGIEAPVFTVDIEVKKTGTWGGAYKGYF